MWSGTPQKIDRKNAPPIVADRPTVSVIGGVQPDRLSTIAGEAGQDGFLDRFLWAYPEVPAMRWTDAEVSEGAEAAINALFAQLRAPLDAEYHDGYLVRPSREARARFIAWHDANALMQEDAPPLLRGVYAKLPQQLLRIALVLHCLAYPDPETDELSDETMKGALALVEFYRAHAARVMAHFHAGESQVAGGLGGRIVRILRMVEQETLDGWATRSDLLHKLGNIKADDLSPALAALHATGTIEQRTLPTKTKDAEQWRLTPASENSSGSKYSNYSKFSQQAPNSSNTSNTSNRVVSRTQTHEVPEGEEVLV
jgi:hypothetical protein